MSIDLAARSISKAGSVSASGSGSGGSTAEPAVRAPSTAAVTAASGGPGTQDVQAAARRLESFVRSLGRSLEFRVDSNTGRTVVTVLDTTSGEVVRQIPSDETLWLAEHLNMASSALLDVSA
jgi:flagellar protein FlaG